MYANKNSCSADRIIFWSVLIASALTVFGVVELTSPRQGVLALFGFVTGVLAFIVAVGLTPDDDDEGYDPY